MSQEPTGHRENRQHDEREQMNSRHEVERAASVKFTAFQDVQIDLLTRIEESMASVKFYLVGMFVGIIGIGAIVLAFVVLIVLRIQAQG